MPEKAEITIHWEKLHYKVKDEGASKVKRWGHTHSLIGSNIYMFGGIGFMDNASPCNDVHLLKLAHVENVDQCHEWSRIQCSSEHLPPARWNHSATQISLMQLLVVGGESLDNVLNDVWVFNCSTFTWHKKELKAPENKRRHGGLDNIPMCRANHTATLIKNQVYLFGGIGGNDEWSRNYLANLCSIEPENWTLSEIHTTGKPPAGRAGHQASASDDKLIIFGGTDATQQYRDIHILNVSERTWIRIEDLHLPRWNHIACFDPVHSFIIIFGGMGSDDACAADALYNDIVIFDPVSEKELQHSSEQTCESYPSPRFGATMVYDQRCQRFILFGGWDNRWCGDLYELAHTGHR